ncbi:MULTISPECIES: FAD-binding oxidoreductase [unclassified Mycolicibacterium]|uniref:FAD-binding oxidoreductase n=1 Tax=unclassified Mycolicibacterium TaxID=2636767 RepID=UPI0013917E0F|nr:MULTISPECIES: FAD-binding oxidoreductase [unclassified Mycolicibacterium]
MSGFDGSVYRPYDDGYEAARCGAVWNAIKPNRFPAVIVVAGTQDDVPRAVNLAREEGLQIGIRSGGHSWVGNAVREGGLLLDLSGLKKIEIDVAARVATVEPGVRVAELERALAAEGLYFPFGHCPTVGVTGFVLGGGYGFNSQNVGPGALSLRAIDVVTAAGDSVHATDEVHSDIMWAARGSGPGFFAVATRLHLDLRPLPAVVAASAQIHPLAAFDDLVAWYLENDCPGLFVASSNPLIPQDDTVLMISAYTFADDINQAKEHLAILETAPGLDRALLHQSAQPTSPAQLYGIFDLMYPEGRRYLSDNMWIENASSTDLWREAKQIIDTLPAAGSSVWLIPGTSMGPNKDDRDAAFSMQSTFSFQIYAAYNDSAQDQAMLAWHNDAINRIDPYSLGAGYVGDSNLFLHPVAVLHPDNAARLEQLRRKYDPTGRFFSYPAELPPARV